MSLCLNVRTILNTLISARQEGSFRQRPSEESHVYLLQPSPQSCETFFIDRTYDNKCDRLKIRKKRLLGQSVQQCL